jgi:hypothetical protein
MNERIKQFADQILPNEKEFHQGNPKEWGYFFSGDELERFAELIISECCGIVHQKTDDSIRVVRAIEVHFDLD